MKIAKNKMTKKIFAGFIVALMSFAISGTPATAAPAVGDPCPAARTGFGVSGNQTLLVCDGSTWNSVLQYNQAGDLLFRLNYDSTACDSSLQGRIRFASVSKTFEGCDGSSWRMLAYADTTPDAFAFTDQTGVALSTLTASDIVQIMGIGAAATVSITGTGTPEYRICADGTCSGAPAYTATAGTINNGDYLQLRLTSNVAYSTMNSTTVTVGTSNDQWDVTTKAEALSGNLLATLNNPAPAAGDYFGYSVAVSGNIAVVGAHSDDPGGVTDAGTAYVFDTATGNLLATLNNPAPVATDRFGYSVAVSGSTAVVGAYFDDPGGVSNAGTAYVF